MGKKSKNPSKSARAGHRRQQADIKLEDTVENPRAKEILQLIGKKETVLRAKLDLAIELVQLKDGGMWNAARVVVFHSYVACVKDHLEKYSFGDTKLTSSNDTKFLKGITGAKGKEPAFFVAFAYHVLGSIALHIDANMDSCSYNYKQAILAVESADVNEKARVMPSQKGPSFGTAVMPSPLYKTVCGHLTCAQQHAIKKLNEVRQRGHIQKFGSGDKVIEMSTVSGDQCDGCGTKPGRVMEVCGRCQVTYYCSRACQQKDWDAGHKQCCRKKGQFCDGDLVETLQPFGSVDIGCVCRIVSLVPGTRRTRTKDRRRFVVSEKEEGGETCTISARKLRIHTVAVRGLDEDNTVAT
ncbi:ankyrin 3, node of Ranvier (ankyrin G) [Seminavis robusta]|uniref:Ankyrin 3, node of Ranvier (Ankyrin G) n=1 Tax=Seminavis robusta TaxID=568900 RepID=A0A9N8D5L9_9STRA|nr:ankyrin 3, node of Ranvier (ankyrin G) [Seminavis robusta]|eukprot:Sro6_g005100.1 ankyrin 3, node of Ranvier (ankyrin G) (354) ;mRNA; r:97642-98703